MPKRLTTLPVAKTPRFVDMTHRARGTQYAIFGIEAKRNTLLALDTTTQKIVHSYDDGVTYSALCDYVFPASVTIQHIHYLPDGEIVVGTTMTGSTYGSRVYRSTGWRNPATATFTNTFNLPADTYFAYGSFSGHKDVVFIGEYGKQTKDANDNGGNPAARAYLSRDGGKTFSTVLNIITQTFVGESGPWGTTTRMQHLHGVTYDAVWDRLWVVIGDGASSGAVTATVYSDDDGATWNVAFQSPWVHWQSVTPYSLPHGVFMGSDFDGNGIRRFGRDGYRDIGEYSSAHLFDGGTSLQYIATSVFRAPSKDAPVLYSFMAVASWNPGGVVATFDEGQTWVTLFKDWNNNGANLEYKGAYLCVGPTNTGRYVTLFNDTTRYPSGSVMVANLLTPDTTTFEPTTVDPLDLSENTPDAPDANKVRVFGKKIANRMLPAFRGPSGFESALQPLLARNRVGLFAAAGGTTTSNIGYGVGSTGTATASGMAMTNIYTYMKRIEYLATSAATTAVAGFRSNVLNFAAGNAPMGGYFCVSRWGPATGVTIGTRRGFAGVAGTASAPTDVNPSSLFNIAGMGWDSSDTNIQFMHNDSSGTATKIDLGASFPKPSADRTKFYEIAIWVEPGSTNVGWQVTDIGTGAVASGLATTNVPALNQLMTPSIYTSVGGTSGVTGVAISTVYFETDN